MQQKKAGIKHIFRSLHYRNYRLYFFGQSISLIGTWIQRIALPWLVYDLTNSPFLLGFVGFAALFPVFVISPFAGVLIDRWNRYRIMITTQVLAMIQAFVLTGLVYSGQIKVWHIVALSLILGCINAFDSPARQSFMVEMVERKENLGNAIALNSMMVNGTRLIGPSIAGILIAFAGESLCFLVNGLSYFVVIISLLMMRVIHRQADHKKKYVFSDLKEGFRYTSNFLPIKLILLLLALASLTAMPYSILMPVFAKEILHGDSHTFGFLMGAAGLGALGGALFLASRKSVVGLDRVIPFAAGLFGLGLVMFSFTRSFILSMIFIVFTGMGMMVLAASSNSIIQTIVDDKMRGRVMSFYTLSFLGIAPFGRILAGSLASAIGTPLTFLIGGISCIAGAVVFAMRLPAIRAAIDPVYVNMGLIDDLIGR
ncbi:MAG TPA: MFS transporter [Bacteroidales bacterium]|nr:MFS transporter [Bacteroidales bacterium]